MNDWYNLWLLTMDFLWYWPFSFALMYQITADIKGRFTQSPRVYQYAINNLSVLGDKWCTLCFKRWVHKVGVCLKDVPAYNMTQNMNHLTLFSCLRQLRHQYFTEWDIEWEFSEQVPALTQSLVCLCYIANKKLHFHYFKWQATEGISLLWHNLN